MEAAVPRLVYCGPEPIRFSVSSRRSFVSGVPNRKRSRRILAVATDPKPTQTTPPKSTTVNVNGSSSSSPPKGVNNNVSTRINDVSKEIKRVRAQMEEDEQLSVLMRGLRGQNLTDSVFADDNIQLRLVETTESSEFLPLVYDPTTISAYWGKRPRAVASRVIQLLSVAGGFLSRIAGDIINKKAKEK